MSETDQQAAQDTAVGKYTRLGHDVAHAKYALEQIQQQMREVAEFLGKGRRDMEPSWLKLDVLEKIWTDIDRSKEEYENALAAASKLGVAIPYERDV